MVGRVADRRDEPVYDLDRVRELAGNRRVIYASRRVENDAENLDYGPDAVADCVASLQPEEFDESLRYANEKFWQDIYKCRRVSPKGDTDDLYIKLKLTRNAITVVLQSFHRDR